MLYRVKERRYYCIYDGIISFKPFTMRKVHNCIYIQLCDYEIYSYTCKRSKSSDRKVPSAIFSPPTSLFGFLLRRYLQRICPGSAQKDVHDPCSKSSSTSSSIQLVVLSMREADIATTNQKSIYALAASIYAQFVTDSIRRLFRKRLSRFCK